ncbi:hypothetical protein DZE40_001769 [Clostridium beijerinckii]|uniref:Uncharacterized protein n=1 Tax=Clostridium beijerinckii TaxID=1520 RepID=A0A1S8S1G6_CLOBE|nr:hypothetical protein [Clostridium beijerinckii]OOM59293.1 hypothetical protein CLBCK_35920 [Clostridium beijerinckii]
MDGHKNKKRLIITILLQNLIGSKKLSYKSKNIVYKKIIREIIDR